MQKEMNWGYQLPFMVSDCSSAIRTMPEPGGKKRIYDGRHLEAMEVIHKKSPVGFSEKLLNELLRTVLSGIKS